MGCGSSKAVVAVIDTNKEPQDSTKTKTFHSPKKTQSLEHFQVKSSKTSLQKNNNVDKGSRPSSASPSVASIIDVNNNKNKSMSSRLNSSRQSLQEDIRKPSTASSSKSGDSGVYEDPERSSSAKSRQSISSMCTD